MKSQALSIVLPESKPEQIETVLTGFAGMETVHSRLAIFFQGAQGACLVALKEERGHHNASRHSASCGVAWETYIKTKWGFSDDKATRLMAVWKGMKPLVDKLSPADRERFVDFLKRPMLHMTPAEIKTLEKVTHKITTAETQQAFLLECGYLKKDRKAPVKPDPANNGSATATKPTPELLIQDQLLLPIIGGGDGTLPTVWKPIDDLLKNFSRTTKDGEVKAPLYAYATQEQKKSLLRVLKTQREVVPRHLDTMIAALEEALSQ